MVVVDPGCKRVLWVGRGRSRAEVRPFFERLGGGRLRACARWPLLRNRENVPREQAVKLDELLAANPC